MVVGIIALALPFVVTIGDWLIDGHPVRGSISSYYYGRTGGYFVGSLCALGVFFLSYEYRRRPARTADYWLSNVASAAAIGVALFPTSSLGSRATGASRAISIVHVINGRFTRLRRSLPRFFRDPPDTSLEAKRRLQNVIYRICGSVIVASILVIVVNNIVDGPLLLWGEAAAVIVFGISWLVKSKKLVRSQACCPQMGHHRGP